MNPPTDDVRRTIFSDCRTYRYTLWRDWKTQADLLDPKTSRSGRWPDNSYAMFIGLNPSTADETLDDPTIRRCIGFAKRWNFAGLLMTNLFAYRATFPKDMKAQERAVGMDNITWILRGAKDASIIVAAWGTHGSFRHQDLVVFNYLKYLAPDKKLMCLRTTKDGFPEHPLYVPYDTVPVPFVPRDTITPSSASAETSDIPTPSDQTSPDPSA